MTRLHRFDIGEPVSLGLDRGALLTGKIGVPGQMVQNDLRGVVDAARLFCIVGDIGKRLGLDRRGAGLAKDIMNEDPSPPVGLKSLSTD